jgi:hypothetical protein
VAKLKTVPSFTDSRFDFIHSYAYTLGSDSLLPFGARQSFDSGTAVYTRYPHLVSDSVPFLRASSSQRVVDSALNWIAGFASASQGVSAPVLNVILNEAQNDTLGDTVCPNAGSSDAQTAAWLAISSQSTRARLAAAAPGVNLTDADINALESLCAFETLASESQSPWCDIFEREDFEAFEYYGDLDKYYGTGYVSISGPLYHPS